MQTYQEPPTDEEEFEEEIEFNVIPKRADLLEKLTRTPLRVDDLIGENLKKLENLLQNKGEPTINDDLRFQIEGLAIILTAYKLKKIRGEKYLQGSRADCFIEVRYLSNLLKGINRTLESKRKTPTEISDILYRVVTDLLKDDSILSDKYKKALDDRTRIYNVLTKKFFIKYDEEKLIENLRRIGKAYESIKGSKIGGKIEEELSRYKKMPDESLEQLETIQVTNAMAHEGESIKDKLHAFNR